MGSVYECASTGNWQVSQMGGLNAKTNVSGEEVRKSGEE
jgi:hypothetical protein